LKKFISKISVFLIILGLGTSLLSYSIDAGLRKTRYSYYAQWNDLFDSKINADLLVIGSSRARQHFSTEVLDSALNSNSYVIGLEAYRFRMFYDLFNIYLQHNKQPKYLILSLDIYSLHEDSNSYYYQQFLPYLGDRSVRDAYLTYRHRFTIADLCLPLYKYRGERTQIAVGILELTGIKKYPDGSRKGFGSSDQQWNSEFSELRESVPTGIIQKADPANIELFKKLLNYCRLHGIVPILVFSPEYKGYQQIVKNRDEIINKYKDLANQNEGYFMDFSGNELCSDTSYFYNSQHLNSTGARMFSGILARTLQDSSIMNTIKCE
jgi:hypothetical protein